MSHVIGKSIVDLPRLAPTVPRSGVSDAARLALRQLLGDTDRRIIDAWRAGAPALELAHARGKAIENIVAHVWTACIGESSTIALYAVGGFGRGAMFPYSDVDLLVLCESPPQGSGGRAPGAAVRPYRAGGGRVGAARGRTRGRRGAAAGGEGLGQGRRAGRLRLRHGG